jgi:hypothetical protein
MKIKKNYFNLISCKTLYYNIKHSFIIVSFYEFFFFQNSIVKKINLITKHNGRKKKKERNTIIFYCIRKILVASRSI